MSPPAGLILAGGQGRRMGRVDKARLVIGGETLVARAVGRLGPQVDALAISANGDTARFSAGVPVLEDAIPDGGPLSGVLAGLDWAAEAGFESVATVAVDTPFFPRDLVARLVAKGVPSVAATGSADAPRLHPTCALWPVSARDRLRDWLLSGERKVMLFAESLGARAVLFPDEAAFFNVNTPSDLDAAERMAGR